MSIRAEFEKKFPVPTGIEWIDDNQEYRITSDDDYWFDHEGAREAARFVGAWKGWQAARTKSGQGAEPVTYLCHSCGNEAPPPAPFSMSVRCPCGHSTAATIAADLARQAQPQPAQQGSVPEGSRLVTVKWLKRIHRDLDACQKVIWGSLQGCDPAYYKDAQERLAEIDAILSATPQPEGDGWVSSFERAPTKSDADFSDRVIWWEATDDTLQEFRPVVAHYDPNWWEGGYFEDFRKDIAPSHPFWKPTGLKRPQPPKEGE